MPEVILPCPNPKCHGHTKGVHKEYSGGPSCHYMYSVKCCGCGVSGPERREKAAAIAAWNALPRMSTIIAWQFQSAGAALENQRLKARLQGILDNDGGEKGFNAFELDKFRHQARVAMENRHE